MDGAAYKSSVQAGTKVLRFVGKLASCDRFAWDRVRRYTRSATPKEKERCARVKRSAKHKYRPRRVVERGGRYRLAEQGERGGMLYNTRTHSVKGFNEFGLGVASFMFICYAYHGCILAQAVPLTPVVAIFDAKAYSDGQPGLKRPYLHGSAVCTRTREVSVLDTVSNVYVSTTQNQCAVTARQGYLTLLALMLMTGSMLFLWFVVIPKRIRKMDEDHQSAQDYSVIIADPGVNDRNSDEWYVASHFESVRLLIRCAYRNRHTFFSQFGEGKRLRWTTAHHHTHSKIYRTDEWSVALCSRFDFNCARQRAVSGCPGAQAHG
jgi:hypothetical protein